MQISISSEVTHIDQRFTVAHVEDVQEAGGEVVAVATIVDRGAAGAIAEEWILHGSVPP
ncbi:hypothetical protein SSAG_04247 [Streptomyces sp. Mg1]|nr:hypothetical protein SSAG_04247 [Streptomyces sp. Mg1]